MSKTGSDLSKVSASKSCALLVLYRLMWGPMPGVKLTGWPEVGLAEFDIEAGGTCRLTANILEQRVEFLVPRSTLVFAIVTLRRDVSIPAKPPFWGWVAIRVSYRPVLTDIKDVESWKPVQIKDSAFVLGGYISVGNPLGVLIPENLHD